MGKARGQGSLEYLLLIAGAVLVAIIVFLLLFTFAPTGKTELDTDIAEYKKIDLCTGQGGACSFFLNWADGLFNPPLGFLLDNKSSWRTLYFNGITIQLLCGDHVCDKDPIFGNPNTSFEFPIQKNASGQPVCTPIAGSSPQLYDCPYCDVETTDCFELTYAMAPTLMSFCPGADGTPCSSHISFNLGPNFNFAITVPPGQSAKVGVSLVPPASTPDLTGIKYQFDVSELDDGKLVNSSEDFKGASLYWYSSSPDKSGSEYLCNRTSGNVQYGCTIPPGCVLYGCPNPSTHLPTVPPVVDSFCNNGTGEGIPYPEKKVVCLPEGGSPTIPTCQSVDNVSINPGYYHLDLTNQVGMHITVAPFKNVADYVSSVPKGLYVDAVDFDTGDCPSLGAASCETVCDALLSGSDLEVKAFVPSAGNDDLMCSSIGAAGWVDATLSFHYGYYTEYIDTSGTTVPDPHCVGSFDFPTSVYQAIVAASKVGNGDFYLAYRLENGPPINLGSPYGVSGSSKIPPAVRALFYPK
ncbi:MAG: class III signal peptide-containing protein [archaeon]